MVTDVVPVTDSITLRGGPHDGMEITRPANRRTSFEIEHEHSASVRHIYAPTGDPDVWAFRGLVVGREPTALSA